MTDITREALLERKDILQAQSEQALANHYALNGAVQDIDHWLGVLAAKEDNDGVQEP